MTALPVGSTILVPSGPDDKNHLFVILATDTSNNTQLLAPISSVREGKYFDPTCVINEGGHPFINHKSYVFYRKIEEKSIHTVRACLDRGYYILREPVEPDLLVRILDGIDVSEFVSPWVIRYLDENE